MPTGVSQVAQRGKRGGSKMDSSEQPKKTKQTTEIPTSNPLMSTTNNPPLVSSAEDTHAQTLTNEQIGNIIGTGQQHNSPAYHRKETASQIQQNITQNLYVEKDRAPYLIIMQQLNINEITISKHLINHNLIKGIKEIIKSGSNRVRILCKDMESANNIILCDALRKQHNINAFIPNEYIKAIGIVKNVPADLSNQEIIEYLESDTPVETIERLNYWDKNANCAKPGTSLKITFRASKIPDKIKLYYTIKKVEYFIPKPLVCNNCLRFGHIAKACRSRDTKCINCSEPTHAASDINCNGTCTHCQKTCITKCNNCAENGNHRTNSITCPEMKLQTKIKEVMIKQKVTYVEAKNKVSIMNQPSYADVTRLSEFNKQLIERLRETENILRNICNSIQTEPTLSQPQLQSPKPNHPPVMDFRTMIKSHFEKYNLKMPNETQTNLQNQSPNPRSESQPNNNSKVDIRINLNDNNVLS